MRRGRSRGAWGAPRGVEAAESTVDGFVQGLDAIAEIAGGVPDLALRGDGLALFAQVVGGVDDVMVAAPGAGAQGVVAGPGDAGEGDGRSVAGEGAAFAEGG